MFNTKGIEEKGSMSYYITPGVNEVTILNWRGETPGGDRKPFLEVEMKLKGADDKNSTKFRMFVGEASVERTMKQINHIGTRLITKEQLDSIGDENITTEQYGERLNTALSGKSLRMQFNCEEYMNSSNELKTKPSIPNNTWFAEAIEEGSEHPVIPAAISKLKYSKDNQYQNRKYINTNETGVHSTMETKVDLPFNGN